LRALLYFPDLGPDGLNLVQNWTTLNRWISELGFPPGRMLGRRRAWTEREVFDWIERQPTANHAPLKGIAKKRRADAESRRGSAA
jgi:hypothetical protein